MRAALIAVLILSTAPAFAQQHAPTVDQCRADMAVWVTATKSATAELPYSELNARRQEMADCQKVDAYQADNEESFHRLMRYVVEEGFYVNAMSVRTEKFLIRHKLISEFLAEDEAGQR